MEINLIQNIDCLIGLKALRDNSINCCVTSPPYYGLRDYGTDEQIGMEDTPESFIERLVEVFREVKRVMQDDGNLYVNIGDSYAAYGKKRTEEQACRKSNLNGGKSGQISCKDQISKVTGDLKPKDLIGIPWMLAFALRADGWYLREEIIWNKPNPMPESVKDRCTRSHEYIFHFTKSHQYYYDADAIKTEAKYAGITGMDSSGYKDAKKFKGKHADKQRGHSRRHAGFNDRWDNMTTKEQMSVKANKRSVWTIPTRPFKDAHFATFPEAIPYTCILAGCPEGGIVLDPFMGAGTTALVARKTERNFIGFELNKDYIKIAEKRLEKELGLFI